MQKANKYILLKLTTEKGNHNLKQNIIIINKMEKYIIFHSKILNHMNLKEGTPPNTHAPAYTRF